MVVFFVFFCFFFYFFVVYVAWSDTEPVIESWLSPKNPRRKAETKEDEDDGGEVDPSVLHEVHGVPVRTDEKTLAMDPDHMSGMNEEEMEEALASNNTTEGDMFMAVRPYIGTVKNLKPTPLEDQVFISSKATKSSTKTPTGGGASDEAPHASLALQHVHGYAGQKSRNNLFYLKHSRSHQLKNGAQEFFDEIVYHVAGVGIVRSTKPGKTKTNKQRFAFHHTDDILCMALGEDVMEGTNQLRDVVATGEVGKTPKICVWHPNDNMQLLVSLRGFHQRGVTQLCFSREKKDGATGRTNKYLISLGLDDYHSVAVYDWKMNSLLYNARTHKSTVLALNSNPKAEWGSQTDTLFCTAGISHLLFWKKKGRGIVSTKATFGLSTMKGKGKRSKNIILCMDWTLDGTLLAGTANGEILMWAKGIVKREPSKHPAFDVPNVGSTEDRTPSNYRRKKSAINILRVFQRQVHCGRDTRIEEFVVTGGQDGRVILFNDNEEAGGIQYAAAVAGSEIITEGVNRHILELYQYTEEHRRRDGGSIDRKSHSPLLSQAVLDCHIRSLSFNQVATDIEVKDFKTCEQTEASKQTHGVGKLVIGTSSSDILEFTLQSRSFVKCADYTNKAEDHFDDAELSNVLTRGHSKDELWGLAVHPKKESQMFATVGDDGAWWNSFISPCFFVFLCCCLLFFCFFFLLFPLTFSLFLFLFLFLFPHSTPLLPSLRHPPCVVNRTSIRKHGRLQRSSHPRSTRHGTCCCMVTRWY